MAFDTTLLSLVTTCNAKSPMTYEDIVATFYRKPDAGYTNKLAAALAYLVEQKYLHVGARQDGVKTYQASPQQAQRAQNDTALNANVGDVFDPFGKKIA